MVLDGANLIICGARWPYLVRGWELTASGFSALWISTGGATAHSKANLDEFRWVDEICNNHLMVCYHHPGVRFVYTMGKLVDCFMSMLHVSLWEGDHGTSAPGFRNAKAFARDPERPANRSSAHHRPNATLPNCACEYTRPNAYCRLFSRDVELLIPKGTATSLVVRRHPGDGNVTLENFHGW